jgi:hypothetical protein
MAECLCAQYLDMNIVVTADERYQARHFLALNVSRQHAMHALEPGSREASAAHVRSMHQHRRYRKRDHPLSAKSVSMDVVHRPERQHANHIPAHDGRLRGLRIGARHVEAE